MSKLFTTLWNHKKKAIFFGGLSAWGISYGLDKKRTHDEMRLLCLRAKAYGDTPIRSSQSIRKAVVVLNNGAHKGKARKLYDNFAAPILHLAGIQTTLYVTNDTTKLREYLEHIEPTNAVIFAGGDATIYECIQSYLTLKKPERVDTPVGILPLGFTNVVYNSLRPDLLGEPLKIAHAALNIVDGYTTPSDVLEIRIGDNEQKDYALAGLQWGPLKDYEVAVPKYWYLGPFDVWFAHFRSYLKNGLKEMSVALQYVNSCSGCSRCEEIAEATRTVVSESVSSVSTVSPISALASKTWWQGVIPRQKEVLAQELTPQEDEAPPRRFHSINDDCGVIHDVSFATKDLHLLSRSLLGNDEEEPNTDGTPPFLLTYRKEGVFGTAEQTRQRHRQVHHVKKYSDQRGYEKLMLSEVRIVPDEADLVRYPTVEIDGHSRDLTGPIHTKVHARKLKVFSRKPESAMDSDL